MIENKIKFQYEYGDLLAASWFVVRKRWLWAGLLRYIAIVGAIMMTIIVLGDDEHTLVSVLSSALAGVAIAIGCFVVTFLYWLWCVPRSVRKVYSQLMLEGDRAEFSFDDVQLEISDSTSTVKLPWNRWLKWAENERFVLLYRTSTYAHYIPKAKAEADKVAALRAQLDRAEVRKI